MTPEERAGKLIAENGAIYNTEFGVGLIAAAIREAVLAEREACIAAVEGLTNMNGFNFDVADAMIKRPAP